MNWQVRYVDMWQRTKQRCRMQMALMAARRLNPSEMGDVAREMVPDVLFRMPKEQRVPFLLDFAQRLVGPVLSGLDRQEKLELIDGLLPMIVEELPVAGLDSFMDFGTALSEEGDAQ